MFVANDGSVVSGGLTAGRPDVLKVRLEVPPIVEMDSMFVFADESAPMAASVICHKVTMSIMRRTAKENVAVRQRVPTILCDFLTKHCLGSNV